MNKACTRSSIDTDIDGDGTVDVTFVNDEPGKPAPPNNLATKTAKTVEKAIRDSKVDSVNINSTTGGKHGKKSAHPGGHAVDIDIIDGKPVSSSNPGVKKLQDAAAKLKDIRENFGPDRAEKTVNTYDQKTGTRGTKVVQKPKLKASHKTHVHLSSQK